MNDKDNQTPHTMWHYGHEALRDANSLSEGTVFKPLTVVRARRAYLNRWPGLSAFATGVEDLGDGRFDIRWAVEVVPLGEYIGWDTMVTDLHKRQWLAIAGTIICDGKGVYGFEWPDASERDSGLSQVVMVVRCEPDRVIRPMLVVGVPPRAR